MKNVFLIAFLMVSTISFSQQKNISLQYIRTYDKVLKGSIDDRYDITIYLKVENFSEDHMHVFSVKGWYYYDNVKKTIPLVGAYSPQNGLILFNLSDKELEIKILDLDFPGGSVWEKIETIGKVENFNEKFIISDTKEENVWLTNSKKLKLNINNLEDNFLIEDLNLLKIDKTVIDLSKYSLYHKDFEIVSKKITPNETRVLLKYEESGNPNIQGMCGASEDFGYVFLIFNAKNELTYLNELEIENCRGLISSEEIKTSDKKILKYKITDSSDQKEVVKTVTIDIAAITLTK